MERQRGVRWEINDPSADNNFTFRNGEGFSPHLGTAKKGLGVLMTGKMVDNMSFRSDRDLRLFDLPINFIPAVTQQHTHNLAATLYPYATVITGRDERKRGSVLHPAQGEPARRQVWHETDCEFLSRKQSGHHAFCAEHRGRRTVWF